MQHFLSPVNVDFDPSNGSWNVYYIQVYKSAKSKAIKDKVWWVWATQPYAFQSLGHAMNFCKPQMEGEFKQEKPGGMWKASLKKGNAFGGVEVRIQQLLFVFEEEPTKNPVTYRNPHEPERPEARSKPV